MNRVAVVTGTSSGMGLHAAVALAKAGCTVVATVRSKERAVALEGAAAGADVTLDIRELDVTDHAANARFVDEVVADHGSIDVLVNNARHDAERSSRSPPSAAWSDSRSPTRTAPRSSPSRASCSRSRPSPLTSAFANAQSAESAGEAIAGAALADEYRFRWQTSDAAATFAGVSLGDLDGSRVLGMTTPWTQA